jgi:DNA modification methylase
MTQPQTQYIRTDTLHGLEKNPRKITKEDLEILKQSIQKNPDYFWARPLLVNNSTGKLVVYAGNQRLRASRELGLKHCPCIVENLTPEQEKERIIRDNINNGEWNLQLLNQNWNASELKEYGLESKYIENNAEDETTQDEVVTLNEEDKKACPVQTGDIYILGKHRLMCSDSTNQDDVARLMQEETADMVFVDPPYNLNFSGTIGNFDTFQNDNVTDEAYDTFIKKIYTNLLQYSKPSASLYICIDFRNHHKWIQHLPQPLKHLNTIVWDKVFAGLGYKYRFRHEFIIYAANPKTVMWYGNTTSEDVYKLSKVTKANQPYILDKKGISIPTQNNNYLRIKLEDQKPARLLEVKDNTIEFTFQTSTDTDVYEGFSMNYFSQRELEHSQGIIHPTMKPLKLVALTILNSTLKNQNVLDLCAGSGTTLLACEQLQRQSFNMEIDPLYCYSIIKRWETYTQQKAIKEEK